MTTKKELPVGTIILFLSGVALLIVASLTLSPPKKTVPQELIAVLRPHAAPLLPFTLTDQNGDLYTEQQLKGKWSFFFFGYTYCPDICPTTLSTLKLMSSELKKDPNMPSDMQIIFVSVDPDRDTPELLARYMEYFGPEFTGMTGFPNNLYNLAKQFGAAYIKEEETTPGNYLVSHTSSIFLVDPQVRVVASFSPPHNHETITSQYRKIRELF
jgi:protein SCO1/2